MIASFFAGIQMKIMAAVVAASLAICGLLWFQKQWAESAARELQQKVSKLETDLFQKQVEVKGLQIVVKTLETTYDRLSESLEIEHTTNKEIDDAPAEDDAAIAPVLRRTLDGVGRMLHNR